MKSVNAWSLEREIKNGLYTSIDKGMPIEQVQHLLGHEKIDTMLHYAMVKQSRHINDMSYVV